MLCLGAIPSLLSRCGEIDRHDGYTVLEVEDPPCDTCFWASKCTHECKVFRDYTDTGDKLEPPKKKCVNGIVLFDLRN